MNPFQPPPAIITAVKKGDTETVRLHKSNIEAINTSYLNRRALHYATENGNLEMAKLLIEECGAIVDAADSAGDTPLHLAIQRRRHEMTCYLIDGCHADIHRRGKGGNTPLHYASKSGNVETIMYLLERGALAGQRNDEGRTSKNVVFRRKGCVELTERIEKILQEAMDDEEKASTGSKRQS